MIDLAAECFTKNLWSERVLAEPPYLVNVADDTAQAGYIVERILKSREAGVALKAQAVLSSVLPITAPISKSSSHDVTFPS